LHDVVFTGSDKPLLRKDEHSKPSLRSPLRLTVLEVYQKPHKYGNKKNGEPLLVWEIIVMDGSFRMFKVVLNSSIQDIPYDQDLLGVGATLIINQQHEYRIIRNKPTPEGFQQEMMFVTCCDYDAAPETTEKSETVRGDGDTEVTPG
jgi:hypothetical protein